MQLQNGIFIEMLKSDSTNKREINLIKRNGKIYIAMR